MLPLKIFTTLRSPVMDVLLIPILSPLCSVGVHLKSSLWSLAVKLLIDKTGFLEILFSGFPEIWSSRNPEKFKMSNYCIYYRFRPSICPNWGGKSRKRGITRSDIRQRCHNCNGIGARKRIYRNGGNWKNWQLGYVLFN